MPPLQRIFERPETLLLGSVFIMSFGFGVWTVLLNNFVVERASFTGVEIGILQSVREIPGFLAFTAVFVLLVLKEQTFVMLALATTLAGVAITGFLPFEYGLYFTTVVMSTGFHYFETINKSLTLQWLSKDATPHFLGRSLATKAAGSLIAYASIWLAMEYFDVAYRSLPLVRKGIFRYTRNGMYTFGFLITWIPGLWFVSSAALLAALFNHVYIWVHYFCTELPDMRRIYGSN